MAASCLNHLFPAYLQGMETCTCESGETAGTPFPAYLQGMETRGEHRPARGCWGVPSLPTRNGNLGLGAGPGFATARFPAYLQGMETRNAVSAKPLAGGSQPTYKEWKLGCFRQTARCLPTFPAYLQGMETTARRTRTRKAAAFPAYLQGMETAFPQAFHILNPPFPAYLQGMETRHCFTSFRTAAGFPAYLQGMETGKPQ